MKRLFLMLLGALMISVSFAQVVEQGEPVLVYYSPKTTVVVDLEYTIEKDIPGMYAQYAESMIGASEAVMENKTTYTLKEAQIHTSTTADFNRAHKVLPGSGIPMLLTINEKGLLTGYNLPATNTDNKPRRNNLPSVNNTKQNRKRSLVPPFPEEVLKAATPLAQANIVAKQIFHIRETRMYLLNGEVEHAPADGKSMELVLAELDKQERELTELFIGKRIKTTEHKVVRFAPEEKKNILYFSEENGFTDAENLEANTVVVSVTLHPQQWANSEKKKKNAAVTPIVYNLPGSGDVKVLYRGNEIGRRTIPIAQLGIDIPLPKDLFKGSLPSITFSDKTGNIISISK
jgi:hypothetical protein